MLLFGDGQAPSIYAYIFQPRGGGEHSAAIRREERKPMHRWVRTVHMKPQFSLQRRRNNSCSASLEVLRIKPNSVVVVRATIVCRMSLSWKPHTCFGQQPIESVGVSSTMRIFRFDAIKSIQQERRLQFRETKIETLNVACFDKMLMANWAFAIPSTISPKLLQPARNILIRSDNHPSLANGHWLTLVEAKRAYAPGGSRSNVTPLCAVRLCAIFNDLNAVADRDLSDSIQIRH